MKVPFDTSEVLWIVAVVLSPREGFTSAEMVDSDPVDIGSSTDWYDSEAVGTAGVLL